MFVLRVSRTLTRSGNRTGTVVLWVVYEAFDLETKERSGMEQNFDCRPTPEKKKSKKIRKIQKARDFRPAGFPYSCGQRKSNGHCGIVAGLRKF